VLAPLALVQRVHGSPVFVDNVQTRVSHEDDKWHETGIDGDPRLVQGGETSLPQAVGAEDEEVLLEELAGDGIQKVVLSHEARIVCPQTETPQRVVVHQVGHTVKRNVCQLRIHSRIDTVVVHAALVLVHRQIVYLIVVHRDVKYPVCAKLFYKCVPRVEQFLLL